MEEKEEEELNEMPEYEHNYDSLFDDQWYRFSIKFFVRKENNIIFQM